MQHVEHPDFRGRPRQAIAAARPADRFNQLGAAQLDEQLFQIRQRNVLPLGDLAQRD